LVLVGGQLALAGGGLLLLRQALQPAAVGVVALLVHLLIAQLVAAAFLVAYYGARLIARPWLRAAAIVMLVGAFAAAAIGGAFGAFINKVAPIL